MKTKKLRDVSQVITKGTTPTTIGEAFTENGVNFIRAECIGESKNLVSDLFFHIEEKTHVKLGRSQLQVNDLVVTIAGYLGKLAIVRELDLPANINQAIALVRILPYQANVDYLYYYFSQEMIQKKIQQLSSQSVQPNLNLELLGDLLFPDIELEAQKKIAAVLSALDAKIELNKRINAELEAMAKTLYDYWFVQFDFPCPAEAARAQGRPELAGKPYKSSGGRMVWSPELKREIPEGWEVRRLGSVLEISLGGTPATDESKYWDHGTFPWLNSGEVAEFPVLESELKITQTAINSSATELLPKGSVLLSITRHLRPTILAIDACANQSVVGIKENGLLTSAFIYPLIKNEIPRYMTLRTGAQQPHINKETVEETKFVLPQERTLEKYNNSVTPIYAKIISIAKQNAHLASLRDFLLPLLMNGQVTVE